MQNSEITILESGSVGYSGPDAVNLFRAITLRVSLDAYGKHKIRMTRHLTPSAMLKMATEYTHKTYKRGQYFQAAEDLQTWIELMRLAIPTTTPEDREPSQTAEMIYRVK